MKTLLLTLVVLTIVCLDLGYTLTCVTSKSIFGITTENCPAGQNLCFKRWHYVIPRYTEITRGCVATCPKPENYDSIHCCKTDKCNE